MRRVQLWVLFLFNHHILLGQQRPIGIAQLPDQDAPSDRRGDPEFWIERGEITVTFNPDFEMEMRTGGISGDAYLADLLANFNVLTGNHIDMIEVTVDGIKPFAIPSKIVADGDSQPVGILRIVIAII